MHFCDTQDTCKHTLQEPLTPLCILKTFCYFKQHLKKLAQILLQKKAVQASQAGQRHVCDIGVNI